MESFKEDIDITSAETLMSAQEALDPKERDVDELNYMIKTLRETDVDAENVRGAITKLVYLRNQATGDEE